MSGKRRLHKEKEGGKAGSAGDQGWHNRGGSANERAGASQTGFKDSWHDRGKATDSTAPDPASWHDRAAHLKSGKKPGKNWHDRGSGMD